ncbi:CoA transferase [Phenylobacterium terrae]|uniref:CoA transferase n=1 Tax=Phenylobacterium terrae TaxID=2665495 RepID=A0ABW4N8R9_9CAUL
MTDIAEIALRQLLDLAAKERPRWLTLEGGPVAMKTRFHAEEAAAAALAATGLMAAELWRLRGGQAQEVAVATREAAAALTSYHHLVFADPDKAPPMPAGPGGGGRTPAIGFFPTRDGRWIFLHPSFPDSAAKLHRLVGEPVDRADAARKVMGWDALDLENAIAEAGVCGAMVRTAEEWDHSEQGRVLAARPVVEVVKIADSPPEPLPGRGDGPLSGVRTLDLTRVLAGPTCARTLAQYGSDVLYITGPDLPSTPRFVTDTNHGKLSAFLDLKSEDGRKHLTELLKDADVFSQGYRAGALDRLGFSPLELARIRPGIITIAINAYGHEGPWRHRPGWEQLAQTVTGMAEAHGRHIVRDEEGPMLQPGAVTDYTTGFLAALGGMIALERRARYGGSYLVRVSLSQTGVWIRKLGVAGPERIAAVQPLSPEEIEGFRVESQTGFGGLKHLRPAVRMSATPPRWTRPVVPLGTHAPAWPAPASADLTPA